MIRPEYLVLLLSHSKPFANRVYFCNTALFLTETGRPLTPNAITLLLNRLSRRASLTGRCISPSMLRDTFAVRFLQAGGEPNALHERLGVENRETIRRYQQVSHQREKEQKRRSLNPVKGL